VARGGRARSAPAPSYGPRSQEALSLVGSSNELGCVTMPRRLVLACSIKGCSRPRKSHGWCEMHYYRWRRHGDPLVVIKPRKRLNKDFWEFVDVRSENECWLWTGYVQKTGYAQYGGRDAHRVAYEIGHGPVPDGLTVDHLCFVPLCMNPKHLEAVSLEENVHRLRMLHRGRCRRGHLIQGVEDVYIRPDNGRSQCRICMQERVQRWKENLRSHA
jgi:hypothetical protein